MNNDGSVKTARESKMERSRKGNSTTKTVRELFILNKAAMEFRLLSYDGQKAKLRGLQHVLVVNGQINITDV